MTGPKDTNRGAEDELGLELEPGRDAARGTDRDETGQVLRQGIKSALARWVLAKRREARPRAALTPQDEATHIAVGKGVGRAVGKGHGASSGAAGAWKGQRYFAEDYTFTAVQPGLGVVLRLEQLPGRDSQRVWVVILRSDGAWALRGGQLVLRTVDDDRWRAGGLHLDCETPLRRWTLRFVGPLERLASDRAGPPLRVVGATDPHRVRASVDLTFVSTAEPHVPGTDDDPELLARRLGRASWDARLLRAARRERPRGYVQLGEIHGTVALGDVLIPVRAASLRQHHWGVRDWGACDEAYQCFHATEDGRRGWVHHARFPFVTLDGGMVEHRGHREAVRSLGATFEARPRGAPAHASLAVGEAEDTRLLQLELVSDLSFVVDGRGRVDLGLMRVSGPAPGWALWAGLRRTLPRR